MVERSILKDRIREHGGTVYLTIGYRWKNPTTLDHPMSNEAAIEFVEKGGYFMELNKRGDRMCLQSYTANDMW